MFSTGKEVPDEVGVNLNTRCCACFAEEPRMHYLFQNINENVTLADILSQTTSFQIYENDVFPPYLCANCSKIVVDFFNFKVQFQLTQKYIQNVLKENFNISLQDSDKVLEVAKKNRDIKNLQEISVGVHETSDVLQNTEHSSTETVFNTNGNASNRENIQIMTEVGEFTVSNELVQLIESVQYHCNICIEHFLSKDEFLTHMNVVHGKNNINPKKYSQRTLIKVPIAKVIEENFEETPMKSTETLCKVCRLYIPKYEYENHYNEHKNYKCELCEAKFMKNNELKNHFKCKHSDERDFVCCYCHKGFKIKSLLTKHLRLHTHPRNEICEICGQRFNDKSVLKTHAKLKHFPSREFQCYLCGLIFPLKSTLEKHLRRHNPNREKNYSCELCSIKYSDKSSLNRTIFRHLSVKHSNFSEKPSCIFCGKHYSTKTNLFKHLRKSHEGVNVNHLIEYVQVE